jgi:LPXTG-site transpeptidase (sortase) family protein
MIVANPPDAVLSAGCGAGTLTGVGINPVVAGDTAFHLSDATIASLSTCTITVNVKSDTPGNYFNTLGAGSLRTYQKVTNPALTQAQLTVQNIGIAKSFAPVNFQAGGTSTLTITLRNPDASDLTSATLLDNLPANLTVVNSSGSTTCGAGVVTTSNPGRITLANGTIPGGTPSLPGTCTVTAQVTSSTAGTYTNIVTADNLTFKKGGVDVTPSGQQASATLNVYGTTLGVGVAKSFSPADIYPNSVSRLTINLTAPADTDLTGVIFTDPLPSSMFVANPVNYLLSGCGAGTLAPIAAFDMTIRLSGASILRSQTCSISIDVTSDIYGPHINTIQPSNLTDNENRNLPSPVSATLTVRDISVAKAFSPVTIGVNGISTLTITLTNNYPKDLTNETVHDTLPGTLTDGVVVASTPNAFTDCSGGTFTPVAGTQALLMTGATLPALSSCIIRVDVKGISSVNPPAGPLSYTNTIRIGDVTQNNPDAITNPTQNWRAASATLTINPPDLRANKYFEPILVTGGSSSILSVDLVNPNSTRLSGITFTDNLPAHMSIANPVNVNVGTCSGSIAATPGGTSFVFSGGILNGSQSCTLSLSVVMDITGNLINEIPAYSVTSAEGATNSQATSATLTNLAGASVSKVFAPNPINNRPGSFSVLTITIRKVGIAILTGLGVTDNLSGGLVIAPAGSPAAVTTCGGTLTATPGTILIKLENGTLAGGSTSSCTITVSVALTSTAFGNYLNSIPAGRLINNEGITNLRPATDTLKIEDTHNLYDPPSGVKVLNSVGLPELEWKMVWINNSTATGINVQISDSIPTGTTYIPSIHCDAQGSSVTNICEYQSGSNRIFWQGIIGPDLGKTVSDALNAVVITFRVKVSSGVDYVQNKATSLTDRDGDGSFADETITSSADSNTAVWDRYSGMLPGTGFAPGGITILPLQPRESLYQDFSDLWVEIPNLYTKAAIVGVPKVDNAWQVSWLGNKAGWLNETAVLGSVGNSVLTAHLYDANGQPGPFVGLKNLKYGDQVIVHAWGQRYTYEVREVRKAAPDETARVIRHETARWLTLITCRDYDEQISKYLARTVVRAVLIRVTPE